MKAILSALFIFYSVSAICQEDYTLQLNDSTINVALNKHYNITVKGHRFDFTLKQKDTLRYIDDAFSFLYRKEHKVSSHQINPTTKQLTILNAEGSGLLIQKHTAMNPTALVELMLTEMTKESIEYGYEQKRSTYKRELASGQEVDVIRAVLTYKDDINIYEITSTGKKDAGLIIITIKMDDNDNSAGQNLIDLMWQTLKVNE